MPTYEYECTKCGHTFDAFQSMSDAPLVKCPECGKNGLRRLIGGGLGVIFKGSGFYVTDNRNGGNGHASAPTTAARAGDGGSSPSEAPAKADKSEPKSADSKKTTDSSATTKTPAGTTARG